MQHTMLFDNDGYYSCVGCFCFLLSIVFILGAMLKDTRNTGTYSICNVIWLLCVFTQQSMRRRTWVQIQINFWHLALAFGRDTHSLKKGPPYVHLFEYLIPSQSHCFGEVENAISQLPTQTTCCHPCPAIIGLLSLSRILSQNQLSSIYILFLALSVLSQQCESN